MIDQIQITITQLDSNGKLIPVIGLLKENLRFLDFTSGSPGAEIPYATFFDRGNGAYIFGDFTLSQQTLVVLALDDVPILGLGAFYIGAPDLSFLKKKGDTFQGNLSANGNRITDLPTNQDETTDPSDAASVGLVIGVNSYIGSHYLKLTGGILSGILNSGGNRITGLPTNQDETTDPSDAASVGLVIGVNSYIGHNYFNIPENIIIVDSSISESIAGRKYKNIQDAINYAQSHSPSFSNQFNILIFPSQIMSGYIENITLQQFVNLYGIGMPVITGTITGGNPNTKIKNVMLSYSGNLSLVGIKAENCTFRVTNDDTGYILNITSSVLNRCNIINVGQSEFNPKIESGNNNIFINCVSNMSFILQNNDKGSISSLEDVTIDFS